MGTHFGKTRQAVSLRVWLLYCASHFVSLVSVVSAVVVLCVSLCESCVSRECGCCIVRLIVRVVCQSCFIIHTTLKVQESHVTPVNDVSSSS